MQSSLQAETAQAMDLLTTEQLKAAWLRGERVEFGDPTMAHANMPFRETYFPLGFPLTVSANSIEVLDAAAESWGMFAKLFDTEPLQINVSVSSTDSQACPPTPTCRVFGHLSINIADAENFSVNDHSRGYSLIWVTTAALQRRDYFRYLFLESSALGGIASLFTTGIHAACVSLGETGILLCGDSGTGKTTLSYACARAGWTYITDDGSFLVHGRDDRLVVGNCAQVRFRPTAEALFPELRGRGVMERAGVGKPSMEMATEENAGISTSGSAPVRHIVFLKRDVAEQELAIFPTAVARLYMMQRVHCMAYQAPQQVEAIDHLLRVGAYELRYNDLNWAVERLELLAREGR
jgi:hypothetical protein